MGYSENETHLTPALLNRGSIKCNELKVCVQKLYSFSYSDTTSAESEDFYNYLHKQYVHRCTHERLLKRNEELLKQNEELRKHNEQEKSKNEKLELQVQELKDRWDPTGMNEDAPLVSDKFLHIMENDHESLSNLSIGSEASDDEDIQGKEIVSPEPTDVGSGDVVSKYLETLFTQDSDVGSLGTVQAEYAKVRVVSETAQQDWESDNVLFRVNDNESLPETRIYIPAPLRSAIKESIPVCAVEEAVPVIEEAVPLIEETIPVPDIKEITFNPVYSQDGQHQEQGTSDSDLRVQPSKTAMKNRKRKTRKVQVPYFRWTTMETVKLVQAMIDILTESGEKQFKEADFLHLVWERCGKIFEENKIRDHVNNQIRRHFPKNAGDLKAIPKIKSCPKEYRKLLLAIRDSLQKQLHDSMEQASV